jgi:hypothetical protein
LIERKVHGAERGTLESSEAEFHLREDARLTAHLETEALSPWLEPRSPDGLLRELQRELAPGHELYRKPVKALAVASDRDDVLFVVVESGVTKYAVVHLTWSRKAERLPCPTRKLSGSLSAWIDFHEAGSR